MIEIENQGIMESELIKIQQINKAYEWLLQGRNSTRQLQTYFKVTLRSEGNVRS